MDEPRVAIFTDPGKGMRILDPVWEWWNVGWFWSLWKFGFTLGLCRGRERPVRVYEVGFWLGPWHVHGGVVYPVEFPEEGDEDTREEA